jgi:hypothetical protein
MKAFDKIEGKLIFLISHQVHNQCSGNTSILVGLEPAQIRDQVYGQVYHNVSCLVKETIYESI